VGNVVVKNNNYSLSIINLAAISSTGEGLRNKEKGIHNVAVYLVLFFKI
jgi:hypothetical protein